MNKRLKRHLSAWAVAAGLCAWWHATLAATVVTMLAAGDETWFVYGPLVVGALVLGYVITRGRT